MYNSKENVSETETKNLKGGIKMEYGNLKCVRNKDGNFILWGNEVIFENTEWKIKEHEIQYIFCGDEKRVETVNEWLDKVEENYKENINIYEEYEEYYLWNEEPQMEFNKWTEYFWGNWPESKSELFFLQEEMAPITRAAVYWGKYKENAQEMYKDGGVVNGIEEKFVLTN